MRTKLRPLELLSEKRKQRAHTNTHRGNFHRQDGHCGVHVRQDCRALSDALQLRGCRNKRRLQLTDDC